MEQYIPKSALVAEIERRYNQEVQWMERQGYTEYNQGLRDGYANILSSLGTLEIKEVDLEKECSKYFEDNDLCVHDEYIKFAKHFFDLGLKAQKGE